MSEKKAPKNSVRLIAQLLGTEGYSEFCQNNIRKYWENRHLSPRLKGRFQKLKAAFRKVVKEQLDEVGHIILGKYIAALCKEQFDTGLRLGFMTLISDLENKQKLEGAERSSAVEAVNILFTELGWKSGGLASAALEIVQEKRRYGGRASKLEKENKELKEKLEYFEKHFKS